MVLGGVIEIVLGIAAEGKSLEDVASPLSLVRKAVDAVSDRSTAGSSMPPGAPS
jgi:hypothetical protein